MSNKGKGTHDITKRDMRGPITKLNRTQTEIDANIAEIHSKKDNMADITKERTGRKDALASLENKLTKKDYSQYQAKQAEELTALTAKLLEKKSPVEQTKFNKGDHVKITGGSFAKRYGIIHHITQKSKGTENPKWMVDLFSKENYEIDQTKRRKRVSETNMVKVTKAVIDKLKNAPRTLTYNTSTRKKHQDTKNAANGEARKTADGKQKAFQKERSTKYKDAAKEFKLDVVKTHENGRLINGKKVTEQEDVRLSTKYDTYSKTGGRKGSYTRMSKVAPSKNAATHERRRLTNQDLIDRFIRESERILRL